MIISTYKELKKNLKKDLTALPTVKVALIGDNATQFLAIAIQGIGIERGYRIELFEADYNQVERQFLDPTSELYSFDADYVVVFQSTHKLLSSYNEKAIESQIHVADERLEFIKLMCNSIQSNLIYFNYPEIEDSVFGSYANKVESSFTYQIRKLNYNLMNLAQKKSNLFICDIAALQNNHIDLQQKANEFNLVSEEIRFRTDLTKLGLIYDFDYPNELTKNSKNFKDPFHINDSIGEIIIKEIISGNINYARTIKN